VLAEVAPSPAQQSSLPAATAAALRLPALDGAFEYGLACILDGVYTRYAKGAMGNDGAGWEAFGESVVRLAETSKAAASSLA